MADLDIPSTCQIEGWGNIINGFFGDEPGVFVDVGAYDGVTYSNTWPLAVNGWKGLCVEANQDLYGRCVGNHNKHPNVTTVWAAVGKEDDVLTMFTDGRELFTMDVTLADTLGAFIAIGEVTTVSLDSLLLRYDIQQGFDLLSIDVEGMELNVLENFSIHYYYPRMIIVETHEKHYLDTLRRHSESINSIITKGNYVKIYSDTINSIFIRR